MQSAAFCDCIPSNLISSRCSYQVLLESTALHRERLLSLCNKGNVSGPVNAMEMKETLRGGEKFEKCKQEIHVIILEFSGDQAGYDMEISENLGWDRGG